MEHKFFGSKLNTILLFILIILMVFALKFMLKDKETYLSGLVGDKVEDESENPRQDFDFQTDPSVLGKKQDLIYFSIWPGTEVSGIRSYRGAIKGAWFFERNILINILDKDKNLLKASNAVATTDWMTVERVDFEGNIDFTGLPKGPAYFEIHNDNASGLPENDKSILIPIFIVELNVRQEISRVLYQNDELGFSLVSPYGKVLSHTNCSLFKGQTACPFITPGLTGEKFLAYLSQDFGTRFSFAGATQNFTDDGEFDCGAMNSKNLYQKHVSLYGESINAQGASYLYVNFTDEPGAMRGPHQTAYFLLNKGQFPVLGFCAFDISKEDFMKVINSVKIY